MKIMVTGASGFIGHHLCPELLHRGYGVIRIDKEQGDLCEPGVFETLFDRYRPDAVFHLAALYGRYFGELDPRLTIDSNTTMTTRIAKKCGAEGVRLVFVSSSEVYGDIDGAPCHEDADKALPHNLYGLTKRWGEEVCRLYCASAQTLRLSMPYGPFQVPGKGRAALATMLWQAHHGMPITVHRGGKRSWCWVGDTVRGMAVAFESGQIDGTYNIARDDNEETMESIAMRACGIVGQDPRIISVVDAPKAQTLVKRTPADRLRALGWSPCVELEEGMRRAYEDLKRYDKNGVRLSEPTEVAHVC